MVRQKHHTRISPAMQLIYAIGWGVFSFVVFFLTLNLGISLIFIGKILPGVTMNGLSLSGKSIEEAAGVISTSYHYPETGSLLLVDGDKSWLVRPVQLGFYLDPVASAQSAYNAGRKNGFLGTLLQRMNMLRGNIQAQPAFLFDQKTAINYLNSLAAQINQPIHEASISIYGTQVVVQNGQAGRVLDVAATLEAVTKQIQSMQDGIVPLVVKQSDPVILSAEDQGKLAQNVLSQPLTLTLPPDATGAVNSIQIQPADLASLIQFEKINDDQGTHYRIEVNKPLMSAYLTSQKSTLELTPENSRFRFNDTTNQIDLIKSAVIGRTLDIDSSIAAINQALQSGAHTAALGFTFTNPAVTDQMTGAQLGIAQVISDKTTYFWDSTPERRQNIKTAAARFDGLLVAPGETLSMSDVLGDISVENDYAEALIIVGDETIKGVGGGICQVSTTLFRTALYAGFPIIERHPHAYRVRYYEQIDSKGDHDPMLAGMDATVFVPLVDFKFKNDTPYWLLMETYFNPTYNSLEWKFYSTPDGREVSIDRSGPTNIVKAPDPVYRENPDLPKGMIDHTEYAVDGADVTVTRTVTRDGATLYQDTFFTQYEPWGDVYEYGPGTENIPTPARTPSP
jgi:vancomycin resistance protein YoaR